MWNHLCLVFGFAVCCLAAPLTTPSVDQCFKGCFMIYQPVCDTLGQTHGNQCQFEVQKCIAKVRGRAVPAVAYEGRCKSTDETKRAISCNFACLHVVLPVCGSDGKTYSNSCYLRASNCKRRQEGEKVVSIKHKGRC